ncbi:MAG TPA: SHOCT domain-containing protein [Burkholderiales bacterium]|nr:SHOCT domain-containing protein [Burkholderiales bacterium]
MKFAPLIACLLASAMLSGCFGGGADVDTQFSMVSQGQELTDLKRALDEGAITQSEYEKLRKKMINRGS